MIEAGKTYAMKVLTAGLAENASGDKQCLELELVCADGKLWHRLWLTPATTERVRKTLAEFNLDAGDPEFWNGNGEALVDQVATVETESHEYNGKTTVRVKWFNGPHRKRETKQLPPSKVSAIAAMFAVPDDDGPVDDESVPF